MIFAFYEFYVIGDDLDYKYEIYSIIYTFQKGNHSFKQIKFPSWKTDKTAKPVLVDRERLDQTIGFRDRLGTRCVVVWQIDGYE
jgi:hypothetical protein